MENFKRVLVVNRMSEYSREAIEAGISIARKYGAELSVLHILSGVAGTVSMGGASINAPSPYPEESKSYASQKDQAREELEQIIRKEINAGLHINLIIKEGKPLDEVMQVVKEERIDLMVLLSHEEGRLEHMVFGRDNDAILRRMPCSVLLIKREPEAVNW